MNIEVSKLVFLKQQELVQVALKNRVFENAETITFQKNEFLVKHQSLERHAFFIISGAVRNFIYDKKDNEITTWFAFENSIVLSPASFYLNLPAYEVIQALETTEVLKLHIDQITELSLQNKETNQIILDLHGLHIILLSNRMLRLQSLFTDELYWDLINNFPHILQRVPVRYIASFLGVSLETLSRIRNSKKRP